MGLISALGAKFTPRGKVPLRGPEAGSFITQSEPRHNSKDDLFTVCEKVVTEL
jgi:hypothetical protein